MPGSSTELKSPLPDVNLNPGQRELSARHCGLLIMVAPTKTQGQAKVSKHWRRIKS